VKDRGPTISAADYNSS